MGLNYGKQNSVKFQRVNQMTTDWSSYTSFDDTNRIVLDLLNEYGLSMCDNNNNREVSYVYKSSTHYYFTTIKFSRDIAGDLAATTRIFSSFDCGAPPGAHIGTRKVTDYLYYMYWVKLSVVDSSKVLSLYKWRINLNNPNGTSPYTGSMTSTVIGSITLGDDAETGAVQNPTFILGDTAYWLVSLTGGYAVAKASITDENITLPINKPSVATGSDFLTVCLVSYQNHAYVMGTHVIREVTSPIHYTYSYSTIWDGVDDTKYPGSSIPTEKVVLTLSSIYSFQNTNEQYSYGYARNMHVYEAGITDEYKKAYTTFNQSNASNIWGLSSEADLPDALSTFPPGDMTTICDPDEYELAGNSWCFSEGVVGYAVVDTGWAIVDSSYDTIGTLTESEFYKYVGPLNSVDDSTGNLYFLSQELHMDTLNLVEVNKTTAAIEKDLVLNPSNIVSDYRPIMYSFGNFIYIPESDHSHLIYLNNQPADKKTKIVMVLEQN